MSCVVVRQATRNDLDSLVPLFDAYRQFYRFRSDPERARQFLLERFEQQESIVFLAFAGEEAVGFVQLYPSFSSGAMARILVLNDLFVVPGVRRRGVASGLMHAASQYGRGIGAARLTLSTEVTNRSAQALYESLGWKRDLSFCVYQLLLTD